MSADNAAGVTSPAVIDRRYSQMDNNILVRELQPEELGKAVGVISRGMRDNPLHIQAFGASPESRLASLNRVFGIVLPLARRRGALLGALDERSECKRDSAQRSRTDGSRLLGVRGVEVSCLGEIPPLVFVYRSGNTHRLLVCVVLEIVAAGQNLYGAIEADLVRQIRILIGAQRLLLPEFCSKVCIITIDPRIQSGPRKQAPGIAELPLFPLENHRKFIDFPGARGFSTQNILCNTDIFAFL